MDVSPHSFLPSLVQELFALVLTFLWHRDIGRLKCIFRCFSRHRKLLDEETVVHVQEYDEKQELLEERLCWLVARDCNILIGQFAVTPLVLGRFYTYQYRGSIFGHASCSVTKLAEKYPQFLSLENGLVKSTYNLGNIQYSLEAKEFLATLSQPQEVEPEEKKGRKKSHTVSKNLRKKQRMLSDANNNQKQNDTNKNTHLEEEAKLALLTKFGCQPKPFFIITHCCTLIFQVTKKRGELLVVIMSWMNGVLVLTLSRVSVLWTMTWFYSMLSSLGTLLKTLLK